jgi:hypothetical protein
LEGGGRFDIPDAEILNKKANKTSGVFAKRLKVASDKVLNEEQLALVPVSSILAPRSRST